MPRIQGLSGAGGMSGSCSMKGMHGSSRVKMQDGMQVESKRQNSIKQDKIANQALGSKVDARI